jgi:hypothetical protein
MKVLLARLPSYTRAPRTLGNALLATRSTEEGTHRLLAEVIGEMWTGGRRSKGEEVKTRAKALVKLGGGLHGRNRGLAGRNGD